MDPQEHRTASRRGFTLIEIMVVIVIIGLIATLVAPGVMERLEKARITTTEAKMSQLSQVIQQYRMDNNRIPDSLDELMQESEKNLGEAYINDPEKLADAWGNEFVYRRIDNRKYELLSLGADGMEGGEGADADISSDKKKMVGG